MAAPPRRAALRQAALDAFTLLVPLPERELRSLTAMDLSEDAEYLAVITEDASVVIVPLLELMCLCNSSWADLVAARRGDRRPHLLRDPHGDDPVKGALSSMASAWAAMGLAGGELFTEFIGGSGAGGDARDSSALRFTIPTVQRENATISSCVWWTREAEPGGCGSAPGGGGATTSVGSEDGGTRGVAQASEHYVVLGSLCGQLTIVDVARQAEVRSFRLAPIVWLQRCQSRSKEWLLIETAAEPKHWRLLLAATIEGKAGSPPVLWSITDGVALPTSAHESFELEPLSGMPPLYQLLVLRKGRGEDCRASRTGWAAADSEVVGMLVDDDVAPARDDELPAPLCVLLSLPSIPEEPLARIDLPISAAPPGAPGRRSLADVVLLLGGGIVLSIVHISDGHGGEETELSLSTAKPRPCEAGMDLPNTPANTIIQQFRVPGRVVGGLPGYSTWPASSRMERGAMDTDIDAWCGRSVWTTLAVVWSLAEVYILKASFAHLCVTLQTQSMCSLAGLPARGAAPRAGPLGDTGPPAGALQSPEPASKGSGPGEQFEGVLPLVCWSWDVDFDELMLQAGEQAFASALFESKDRAVRAALVLWARRSTDLVPLGLLTECFGQLAQDVAVVQAHGPAILRVLMPHWPGVAAELGGARGPGGPPAGEVGPAAVAWFLSLAVMLLVVMHPRCTGRGEYTRTRRPAASSSSGPAARDFAEEWQAWVSARVTELLSGGRGAPPESFAVLADGLQAEFEAWWQREWRSDHEAGHGGETRGAGLDSPLAPALEVPAAKDEWGPWPPMPQLPLEAARRGSGRGAASRAGASTLLAVPGSPREAAEDCWCSRLLLLCGLRKRWLPTSTSDFCALASHLVQRHLRGGGLLAASALVAVLFRGLALTALSDAAGGADPAAARRQQLPAAVREGLGVVFSLLSCLAIARPADAAEGAWRVLWEALCALRPGCAGLGPGCSNLNGQATAAAGCVELLLRAPAAWLEAALSAASPGGGDSPRLPPWKAPAGSRGGQASWSEADQRLLDLIGELPDWGRCVELWPQWSWEQDGGARAALSSSRAFGATARHPPPLGAEVGDPRGPSHALASLERWLLKNAAVGDDPATAQAGDDLGAAAELERAAQRAEPLDGGPPGGLGLLQQAAAAEAARGCAAGAGGGERLGRAGWWAALCARHPGALPTLVLALMAAEHRWVWELPWAPGFRLHLARALFAARAAAEAWPAPGRVSAQCVFAPLSSADGTPPALA
ncbi:unnamed protein product [Prorocentrum cordatum]|uniref:Uncharacterized protein n=1 Tax=Prorocentrum cordatum TaxID=2364126 RepID=A0ABN9TFG4_9DINO|nr:unnamed protein product [Polarella glacialis]